MSVKLENRQDASVVEDHRGSGFGIDYGQRLAYRGDGLMSNSGQCVRETGCGMESVKDNESQ